MKFLRYYLIAALALGCSMTAGAYDMRADSTDINLYNIDVTVDQAARQIRLRIGLDISRFKVPSEREVVLTPKLFSEDGRDSLAFEPIVVCGRNRYYHYLRSGELDKTEKPVYRAGAPRQAVYNRTVAFEPWMGHSNLEMEALTANCCDKARMMEGTSTRGNIPLADINTKRPAAMLDFVFAPPMDEGPVIKHISGSAFITFVVNRTELKPDYMVNRRELDKIVRSIDYVRNDTDATITHVHIKGFASPEGPYDNNVRLAKGRTETLRRYVRDLYSFADTTVTKSFEPEDWGGLRTYVTDSMQFDIANRRGILEIIDGPLGLDEKNRSIQRLYPADYRVLLKEIYPWLRHSDYTVTYKIRVYTDINEIRRVYDADPSRLRPVDFYTLAQTYAEGSSEYCAVFEKAVEVYPDDPMLNLNAANIALQRGLLDDAQSCLLKAGNTPQANYARGILAVRRDDLREAVKRFEAAGKQGLPQAVGAIEAVRRMEAYHPVTYRITPIRIKEANR